MRMCTVWKECRTGVSLQVGATNRGNSHRHPCQGDLIIRMPTNQVIVNNDSKDIFPTNNSLNLWLVLRPSPTKVLKIVGPKYGVGHLIHAKVVWIKCKTCIKCNN